MSKTTQSVIWNSLDKIDNSRTTWILKLRAIHVYHVLAWAKGDDSMEVIFHDEHGTRIHAHLKRPEKKKFENQIVEDGVFAIRNVFVHGNYQLCKTTSHKSLLVFYTKIEVKTLSERDFPKMNLPMQVDDASASTTLMLLGENEDDVGPVKITPLKTLLDTKKPGAYYILPRFLLLRIHRIGVIWGALTAIRRLYQTILSSNVPDVIS
ncbi:unnamed protein product [Cuscuta campestris]|uniref:Replication protein A 70 kDa DNA-binding subunit B/D first OB fold domain-containing protein n=1 Tax=Cuscuta campestris TaxID=132261 RepID=A0A484K5L2_9ASTE|nr:unnamed protein product [Cuscuta campestris]